MEILEKVTALAVEGRHDRPHLLTIEHPQAGRQLPAGTVEINESPDSAVVRELREESGLGGTIVAYLNRAFDRLPANRWLLLRSVPLLTEPDPDASVIPYVLGRGSFIDIDQERQSNGYLWGVHALFDRNSSPPRPLARYAGWVDPTYLTNRQLRHTYQLAPKASSPDAWWHTADGHRWRLAWVPLNPLPALIAPQDRWLVGALDKMQMQG